MRSTVAPLSRLRVIITLALSLMTAQTYADEAPIQIEKARINTHDIASVQRGAKAYASYCLTCHALRYMENDPIAKAAGITPQRMPNQAKNWWFGSAPPDLTLMAKIHGRDWLYTYLHVFYKDPSRPSGSNNLLMNNLNMPNPFLGLQGEQEIRVNKVSLINDSAAFSVKIPYYTVLELTRRGSLTPDEFDQLTNDLVNFLVYASEPKKFTRERLGIGVLLFILVMTILMSLIKRAYWKKS